MGSNGPKRAYPPDDPVFLSVYVDDIKMAGKKQNLAPMWKKLMKNVGIDAPTSSLVHVHLGCTQRVRLVQLLNSKRRFLK